VEIRADGEPLSGSGACRARAIARSLVDAREPQEALLWFERALERAGGVLPTDCARPLERARKRAAAKATS
jgi:hypothetical protein